MPTMGQLRDNNKTINAQQLKKEEVDYSHSTMDVHNLNFNVVATS
jgi:hypothetical protein